MAQTESQQDSEVLEPSGIGGWLILPVVHLVLNAGLVASMFVTSFMQGYGTQPSGTEQTPTGEPDIGEAVSALGEIAATFTEPSMLASLGVALLALWVFVYAIFALIRLFQKKKHVPKMMIGFYILLTIMTVANAAAIHFFPGLAESEKDINDAYIGVVRVVVACAIWIPYFIVSERVKNTFVR